MVGDGTYWSSLQVKYCDVEPGTHSIVFDESCSVQQENNLDDEPLFFDAGHWSDNGTPNDPTDDKWMDSGNINGLGHFGDYHLKSEYGRWDGYSWVTDNVTSPCIDAGTPYDADDSLTYFAEEPSFNGGRVNLGYDGNTAYASRSYYGECPEVFTVSDVTTDSLVFTNDRTVVANLTLPSGWTSGSFALTETDEIPSVWSETPITSYTITGSEGAVNLYGWVKDANGNVGGRCATIYYSTATPTVTRDPVWTDNGNTMTITWSTDVPAEGAVTYASICIRGAALELGTETLVPEAAIRSDDHRVTVATESGRTYKITSLVNNETSSSRQCITLPSDVNFDCKVNILDLIAVRNRLNTYVGQTGYSVYCDVNLPSADGKINILDLIAVRNKLNTFCPNCP